jgi:exosortase A-associated hydrolase 2
LNGTVIIPRFIDGPRSRIFTLMYRPATVRGGSALLVPPFAEEMNKTRKIFTDLAQQLAQRGIATILPDLHGTGDSGGEFSEADWTQWAADVALAAKVAADEGWPVKAVVGARLGCLLAARVARESLSGIEKTVFWQPVTDGERYLTQFLRLRVAASMADASRKETVAKLKEQMRREQAIEVSGYALPARLAEQMEKLRLSEELGPHVGALHWLEVVRDMDAPLPTPTAELIERARKIPLDVAVERVPGEPFWQSTEIVRNAALVERTVAAIC